MRDDVIGYLLKAPAGAVECVDVAAWWPRHRELAATWRNPMDRDAARISDTTPPPCGLTG